MAAATAFDITVDGGSASSTDATVQATLAAATGGAQFFGSAATRAIAYNSSSIAENVTVTAGNNGLSAGPITVNSGFTVTVESGSRWVIV